MIQDVTFEKTLYQEPPQRFEAGTGNIADAVGLGAAIDYLDRVGMHNISRHEHELLVHATSELSRIPGLHIIGTAKEKAGVLSFVLDGFRTEEVRRPPQPKRDRRSLRSPLRTTDSASLRIGKYGSRLAGSVQHS